LANAEKLRGIARERFKQQQGRPVGIPTDTHNPLPGTWTPNWFVRNRHLMRGKFVRRILVLLILVYGTVDLATINLITSPSSYCEDNEDMRHYQTIQVLFQSIFMIPFGFLLIFVVWKLRKHSQDGYGLLDEVTDTHTPLGHHIISR
jgi:hypothetical protein